MKNSLATPCESICARAAGRRGVLIKIIRVRGEVLLISPDNRRPSLPAQLPLSVSGRLAGKRNQGFPALWPLFREGLGSLFLPRRQHRNLVQGVGCLARSNTGIFEERLLGPDGNASGRQKSGMRKFLHIESQSDCIVRSGPFTSNLRNCSLLLTF